MMMRTAALILALTALVVWPAVADDDEEAEVFASEGSYMSLNFTGGFGVGDRGFSSTNGYGFGARVGGHAFPHFALEMQWDWMHDVANVLTLNGKFPILTGRIQPFALLGVGFTAESVGGLYGAWRVGGGVDFFLNDSWKLVGDITYTKAMASGQLEHIVMGLGVGYHFY